MLEDKSVTKLFMPRPTARLPRQRQDFILRKKLLDDIRFTGREDLLCHTSRRPRHIPACQNRNPRRAQNARGEFMNLVKNRVRNQLCESCRDAASLPSGTTTVSRA